MSDKYTMDHTHEVSQPSEVTVYRDGVELFRATMDQHDYIRPLLADANRGAQPVIPAEVVERRDVEVPPMPERFVTVYWHPPHLRWFADFRWTEEEAQALADKFAPHSYIFRLAPPAAQPAPEEVSTWEIYDDGSIQTTRLRMSGKEFRSFIRAYR